MNNAQLRFVFDRLKQASDTNKGLLQIEVRITGTNRVKLISTGIHLLKNQFSPKNGFTCRNHPNAPAITGNAASLFRKIEAFVLSENCKSLDDVKQWNRNEAEMHSVIEFMKQQLAKINPTMSTFKRHYVLIRKMEKFGKIRVFSDINYSNIVDFDAFLKSQGVNEGSSLNKLHSIFRRYIRMAIYMELCKKDPYIEFKMPSKKGKDPTFLIQSEIEKIKNWHPVNEKLEHVKDLFIFQCFTGMAYADMANFSKNDIFEIDGKKVIRSNREKTEESFISLLLPEVEEILEKYNYKLPVMSNQKYNDYLKVLGA